MNKLKAIYLLLFGLVIFLAGCSSTYTLKDYTSKQKFYDDFNNFAKNRNVKVILSNDSSFVTKEGTRISNDSLIIINKSEKTEIERIPLSDIKSVNDFYDAEKNHTIVINLKDGREFHEKRITYLPDSSINIPVTKVITTKEQIPLSKVKKVNYKINWLGLIPGVPVGFVIGAAFGIITLNLPGGSNLSTNFWSGGGGLVIGTPVITLIGGAVGWLIGFNYSYIFNP